MRFLQLVVALVEGFGAAVNSELARVTKAGPELRASLTQMANETLAFLEQHRRR